MSPRLIEEDKVNLGVEGLNKVDGGLPALGHSAITLGLIHEIESAGVSDFSMRMISSLR